MPLQLNTPESARDKLITWDPDNLVEANEAREEIARFRRLGFTVSDEANIEGECKLYAPSPAEHQLIYRVLSENGDDRLVWDRRNKDEVEEAKVKFEEYVEKGYKAYVCRRDGSKGSQIDSFDALLQEVIMEKGQVVMVPKTMPG
jgi:hypothetical protein